MYNNLSLGEVISFYAPLPFFHIFPWHRSCLVQIDCVWLNYDHQLDYWFKDESSNSLITWLFLLATNPHFKCFPKVTSLNWQQKTSLLSSLRKFQKFGELCARNWVQNQICTFYYKSQYHTRPSVWLFKDYGTVWQGSWPPKL